MEIQLKCINANIKFDSEFYFLYLGVASGEVSVVIIPDVEPDQPKPPEIIMVEFDDEEEVDENKKTTPESTRMKVKKVRERPGVVKSTVISVERKKRESRKKKAESHKSKCLIILTFARASCIAVFLYKHIFASFCLLTFKFSLKKSS